jgi:hypothetical protein
MRRFEEGEVTRWCGSGIECMLRESRLEGRVDTLVARPWRRTHEEDDSH